MVTIRIPGYEDYISGQANIKSVVLGVHGVGKTRWSSYWERPLIAATEPGTASILDRRVPVADIKSSQDLLDTLALVKRDSYKPKDERRYRTFVLDTGDAWQRLLMRERRALTGKAEFSWEDWSWLDVKQAPVIEKLMELDCHVLVLMHYKDKSEDDEHWIEPRLKGDLKDSLFDPFDLVGLMDWEFGVTAGGQGQPNQVTQKRFLSYVATPEARFLKDRFYVMPKKIPVTFATSDYQLMYEALEARAATLEASQPVEDVPTVTAEDLEDTPRKATVVPPEAGGPVPTAAPPAAAPPARKAPAKKAAAEVARDTSQQPAAGTQMSRAQQLQAEARAKLAAKGQLQQPQTPVQDEPPDRSQLEAPADAPFQEPGTTVADAWANATPAADPSTGVDVPPAAPVEPQTTAEAVANVEQALGEVTEVDRMGIPKGPEGLGSGNRPPTHCGHVVEEGNVPEGTPQGCGAAFVAGENDSFVGVSKIKYRTAFCDACFGKARQLVRT